MSAPKDIIKSTYSFWSASQTCEPLPRSRNIVAGEYVAFPREGEFTPSTKNCWARSNYCWERVRERVRLMVVKEFQVLVCGPDDELT